VQQQHLFSFSNNYPSIPQQQQSGMPSIACATLESFADRLISATDINPQLVIVNEFFSSLRERVSDSNREHNILFPGTKYEMYVFWRSKTIFVPKHLISETYHSKWIAEGWDCEEFKLVRGSSITAGELLLALDTLQNVFSGFKVVLLISGTNTEELSDNPVQDHASVLIIQIETDGHYNFAMMDPNPSPYFMNPVLEVLSRAQTNVTDVQVITSNSHGQCMHWSIAFICQALDGAIDPFEWVSWIDDSLELYYMEY
jgi:hypothetical protein